MQYKANQISLPFFTRFSIHLQAIHPTTNDAMKPTARHRPPTSDSEPPPAIISFISSNASPRIGIITMRNENDATFSRLSPSNIPVAIVVPDLLSPGNTAIAWDIPITKASIQVMSRGSHWFPDLLRSMGRVRKKYAKVKSSAVMHRHIPTNEVFEAETNDCNRNARHENLADIEEIIVELYSKETFA